MGYVTIDNITVRVTGIALDPQLQRPARPIVGGGSNTQYLGEGGRAIILECRARKEEYQQLDQLRRKGSKVSLISQSKANYNGHYHIIGFNSNEYKKGLFTITIKLIEHFTYNVTRKDFVNYTVSTKKTTTDVDIGEQWNPQ